MTTEETMAAAVRAVWAGLVAADDQRAGRPNTDILTAMVDDIDQVNADGPQVAFATMVRLIDLVVTAAAMRTGQDRLELARVALNVALDQHAPHAPKIGEPA